MQLGTLAVGAVAGAADAGAFRLAQRLAKGIVRPMRPVTVALYPELSRLVAEDDHAQLRTVVLRLTILAGALAFLVVLVTGIAGREILGLLAGETVRVRLCVPVPFIHRDCNRPRGVCF